MRYTVTLATLTITEDDLSTLLDENFPCHNQCRNGSMSEQHKSMQRERCANIVSRQVNPDRHGPMFSDL